MILTNTRKPKPQLELVANDETSSFVLCANGQLKDKMDECRANGYDVLSMDVVKPSGYRLVVRKQSVTSAQYQK